MLITFKAKMIDIIKNIIWKLFGFTRFLVDRWIDNFNIKRCVTFKNESNLKGQGHT